MVQLTPLDNWIARKINLPANARLTLSDLQTYQMKMLRKTVDYAKKNSPFYARHFSHIHATDLTSIADIPSLPCTTPHDLITHGLQMLCVSQSQIARVITLRTSGTTASPKRIYFTEEDLELTADFFAHGMQALVRPGQKTMVLMPGPNPGSVGERLSTGLKRISCPTIVYGLVQNPEHVIKQIITEDIDCLIGLPVQVLSLIRTEQRLAGEKTATTGTTEADEETMRLNPGQIKSVLLSADYVPKSIIEAIRQAWNCPVFTHYGMTETGLGGGVECQALQGCHLREADLLMEIVDSRGESVPDGQWGEIVVTTLTRLGMPLIRYRTGDISRFLAEPCACGSHLKRLDRVRGRSIYDLPAGQLRLDEMDEALFTLPDIVDFEVRVQQQHQTPAIGQQAQEKEEPAHCLEIKFWPVQGTTPSRIEQLKQVIEQAVYAIPSIRQSRAEGNVKIHRISTSGAPLFTGGIKRKIKKDESVE